MALDATVGGVAADTYGTLVEADAYFDARESADWGASDSVKELALRKAATYLDNVYRGRWKGVKATSTQALAWPRAGVVDVEGYGIASNVVPQAIKRAQFEAAKLIAGGTELEATVGRTVSKEKIGPMEVTYAGGAALVDQYPQITNCLGDLVTGGGVVGGGFGSTTIMRA